jgi:ring-1,2-phenylacetyl-CoA epoxidase subunit PaaE
MPAFHTLTIRDIRRETDDCVSVAFEVPEGLQADYHFTQGQYLTLRTTINDEDVRRSYSICTSPTEADLRVAIKKVPGGRFSTYANDILQIGDSLQVMTPMGNFFTQLDPEQANHYVAFAAGSGITPVMSILKTVLTVEPKSVFTLFYGNRTSDSIIFKEELEGLKNQYMDRLSLHHILSREQTGSPLFNGRIDEDKVGQFCTAMLDVQDVEAFFLCGPETMIRSIQDTLVNLGVDEKRVHYELFTTPGADSDVAPKTTTPKRTHAKDANIQIQLDGDLFNFPMPDGDVSLLDAALEGGLDLPFSCKGGVCCTCRAKLIEGEVEMDVNYALEPDEVAAGYILTCQAHPVTAKVAIDFDS